MFRKGIERQNILNFLLVGKLIVLLFFISVAHAEGNKLPDISSGIPVNELKYPEEAWSPDILKMYEIGPVYLSKDEEFIVDPPPSNDSEQTKSELEQLRLHAVNDRDSETMNLIAQENVMDPFASVYGRAYIIPQVLRDDEVERVIRAAVKETGYFILREKLKYARARPIQLAPDLKLAIDTPKHASYPSGHAGQSYAAALVLSKLDPERSDYYLKVAYDIGLRREIAGVHYPSDSNASRKLAEQVVDKLMLAPDFKTKFQKAEEHVKNSSANKH